jgi:hypothetical protein
MVPREHGGYGGTFRELMEVVNAISSGELWITNAYSERGTRSVNDFKTTVTRDSDGWRLNGTFYCTGSLGATPGRSRCTTRTTSRRPAPPTSCSTTGSRRSIPTTDRGG